MWPKVKNTRFGATHDVARAPYRRIFCLNQYTLKSSPFMATLGALQGQKAPRQNKKNPATYATRL